MEWTEMEHVDLGRIQEFTEVAEIPGGCLVRTQTVIAGDDGFPSSSSEAMVFVPGVTLADYE
jgi:hypothetical protein